MNRAYHFPARIITIDGDPMWEITSELSGLQKEMPTGTKPVTHGTATAHQSRSKFIAPSSSATKNRRDLSNDSLEKSVTSSQDKLSTADSLFSDRESALLPPIGASSDSCIVGSPNLDHRGLCGLNNIGNTCFMNSVIQCLSNVWNLKEYFVQGKYEQWLNSNNPAGTCGEVARSFAELLIEMWTEKHCHARIHKLKSSVDHYAPRFRGYHQQDAHEFLLYLLDALHEDLKSGKNHSSVISKLFHGQMLSIVKCITCPNLKKVCELFNYLPLSLPQIPNQRQIPFNFCYISIKGIIIRSELKFDQHDSISQLIDRFMKQHPELTLKYTTIVAKEVTTGNTFGETFSKATLVSDLHDCTVIFYEIFDDTRSTFTSLKCLFRKQSKQQNYLFPPMHVTTRRSSGKAADFISQVDKIIPCLFRFASSYAIMYQCSSGREEVLKPDQNTYLNMLIVVIFNDDQVIELTHFAYNDLDDKKSSKDTLTLDFCIANLFVTQNLSSNSEWFCSSCNKLSQSTKSNQLLTIPLILIFQLKRFDYDLFSNIKIDTFVDYPLKLKMPNEDSHKRQLYDLIAVCLHTGSLSSGHYFTYAKHRPTSKWYCFNDTSVRPIENESTVIDQNAYLLFYEQRTM